MREGACGETGGGMNRVRDDNAAGSAAESSHRLKARPSGLRLWLLEELMTCEQREEVASLGATWTSDSLGVLPALCLLSGDAEQAVMRAAGLRDEATRSSLSTWLARQEVQALLCEARGSEAPTLLSAREARALGVPEGFSRRGLWLLPLHSPSVCHGLILCAPPSGDLDEELTWAAKHLGSWLARMDLPAMPSAPSADDATVSSVAGVVHELRAPLSSILGHSAMLLQGLAGELSPDQSRMLQRIDSSGRHALALVSDLLELARLEARHITLEPTSFSVPELLSEVAGELTPLAQPGVEFLVERAEALQLFSDRLRLKQILVNLVSNALKFTAAGQVCISVKLSPAHVVFSVSDTGFGICEDDLSIIFEPFAQASPSRHKGTGLGLAICRELSQLLEAELLVESVLDQGSTFSLLLPIAAAR